MVSLIVWVVSESEYRVLKSMADNDFREGSLADAARILGIEESSLASIVMLLREKGIVEVREVESESLVLTDKGAEALREGLPERRLLEVLIASGGSADISFIVNRLGRIAGIAVGKAREEGLITVEKGRANLAVDPGRAAETISKLETSLRMIADGRYKDIEKDVINKLLERGLVKRSVEKTAYIRLLVDPASVLSNVRIEVAKLTHDMIKDGGWRNLVLREYNVKAEPYTLLPARTHFLRDFIEKIRDVMVELGFREVEGPIVEVELFNFDLLFQAQDHPAREIHDSLWLDVEPYDIEKLYGEDLVERVARVHERGWGYKWSRRIASRAMLRSQTTAVSVRVLSTRPKPPIRFFTIGRVFRHDAVDATHLPEFHQLDGIEGWHGYTFRDLLLTLKEIFERLGLEVKFKPAYFPFTEPSVEGYVRLPSGKWLELFGAGLFRPEVLEMTGVDYPVGAWGFGIERLAAAYYGLTDIRLLYSGDVEYLKSFPARW